MTSQLSRSTAELASGSEVCGFTMQDSGVQRKADGRG